MVPELDDSPPDNGLVLLRLLQLASPALPVGAFAYSQGLESAVAAGLVTDETSAARWILGLLGGPFAEVDVAIFGRLHAAFCRADPAAANRWSAFLLAARATAELQAEELHLGGALARVLATLGIGDGAVAEAETTPRRWSSARAAAEAPVPRTFAQMFALATARWSIPARAAALAFAFTWAEAQTSAAVRLVPLGQSAGVRILAAAGQAIPGAVDRALALEDDDVGAAAPLQALLSTAHETQYSRLFRS